MSERSTGVPGCAIDHLSAVRDSRIRSKTGGTSVLKTVLWGKYPVNMAVQDQSDQFKLSKEQAKVARGSHLSRSCMQGQPSDAASGGRDTLGRTCLQGGNDRGSSAAAETAERPNLESARSDDEASIESRRKGPSNTKSAFFKAQKFELRIHGSADSRDAVDAASSTAERVGSGA